MAEELVYKFVVEGAAAGLTHLKQLRGAQDDLEDSAKDAASAENKLADAEESEADAAKRAAREARELADAQEKHAAAVTKAGATVTKLATILAGGLAVGLGFAIKAALNFEDQIDQVGAVSQASELEMAGLSQTAKQLGADTAFSAGEAAAAMEELAAGGRSVAQIMGGEAKASVDLAAAGNYGLAESAKTIATTMDIWKDSQLKTNDVVNRLAGAANTSRFGVEDMATAIAQGGGVAATAGLSFADFTASIAATASSFSSGSDAGTSFKTFLIALTGNSDKAKEAMAALGLSFFDAQGAMRPMADIVQQLHDKIVPLSQEQQTVALKTIFGNDAFRTAAGLMKLTGAEFTAMSDKMGATDAAEVAAVRMGNLSGNMEALKGSLETVAISVGERAIPALSGLTEGAATALNKFGELPAATQNLLFIGVAATTTAPLMVSLFKKIFIGAGDSQSAIKKLKLMMESSQGIALKWAAGVSAGLIGLDLVLQQLTGKGLLESVTEFFGGLPSVAERADESLVAFNERVKFLNGESEKLGVATAEVEKYAEAWVSLDGVTERISGGFEGFVQELGQILGGVGSNVEEFEKLEGSLLASATAMEANGATALELATAHSKLPPFLQDIFEKGVAWNGVIASLEKDYRLTGIATTELGAAFEAAQRGIGTSSEKAKISGASLLSYYGDTWSPVLQEVFSGLSDEAKAKLADLGTAFPPLEMSAESLANWLSDKLGEDVTGTFEKVNDAAHEAFDSIIEAIESVLPATDETFAAWKTRLETMITDQANFETNLTEIYAAITTAGVSMPDEIITAIATKGPAFVAHFTKLFSEDPQAALDSLALVAPAAMGETVDAVVGRVIGAEPGMDIATYKTLVEPMQDNLKIAQDEVEAGLEKMWLDAATETASHQADMNTKVRDLTVGAVENSDDAAATAAKVLGMNIALGIAGGIGSSAYAVNARMTTLVQDAIVAGEVAARAKSPSEEAAEQIGEPLGEGVAVGILDSIPSAVAAMETLVSETMAAGIRASQQGDMGGGYTGSMIAGDAGAGVPNGIPGQFKPSSQVEEERERFGYGPNHIIDLEASGGETSIDEFNARLVTGSARNIPGYTYVGNGWYAPTGPKIITVDYSKPTGPYRNASGAMVTAPQPVDNSIGRYVAQPGERAGMGQDQIYRGPGSIAMAPRSSAGGQTGDININLSGSTFTGTPGENAEAIGNVIRQHIRSEFGRDARLYGVGVA